VDSILKSEDTDGTDPYDTLAYIVGSQYRQLIVSELSSGPATPTNMAEEHDVHVSHVSRGLGELADRGVVSAYGTDSRTRLYRLTEHGKTVAKLLDEYEEGEND
jgi:DNA-binding HxlR family transcriptional regulator